VAALCLATVFSFPSHGADTPTPDNLDAVQRALESERQRKEELERQAGTLRREADAARQERIKAARAIQDHEAKVSALTAELIDLGRREARTAARLGDNRVNAARVVMALQRLARNPPEAVLAQPLGPNDLVRSAILLRAAVPGIEARVEDLRRGLDELVSTRRAISRRRADLEAASDALGAERRRLDALFAEKKRAIASVDQARAKAARRLGALAEKAKSLRDLLDRIERDRREQLRIAKEREKTRVKAAPPPAPEGPDTLAPSVPFSKAKGDMPFPAVGQIVRGYGAKTGAGFRRKGLTVATLAGAQVVAPYDGKIVYADQFRGYGLLLILDHGEGYHSLLAGMERIDGVLGQRVLAGEPVGIMGRPSGDKPELYVELRHNGHPINPTPWLSARNE
jgi:septal ring factor EnvC (AmiA/AmiB activator)